MSSINLSKLLGELRADELVHVIRLTRRQWVKHTAIKGACWLVAAFVGWLVVAAALDMLIPLPVPMRVILCAGLWLTAAAFALRALWPLVRLPSLQRVAFQIENTIPGMHNRLVSVLDLQQSGAREGEISEPFVRRLVEQAAQKLQAFKIEHVVNRRPMVRSGAAAGATLAIAGVLVLALHDQMPVAMQRIMQPTAPIAPASWVRLAAAPGDQNVLLGDPVTIQGLLTRGSVDGLTLRLRARDGGAWTRYAMQPADEGSWQFTISALTATQQYQILGGGTWTPVHTLGVVRRPVIETVRASVHLPAYMTLPEPQPVEENAVQISAPKGAQVELAASVQGEIAAGQVQLFTARETSQTQTKERATVWFDDDTPADAELIGRWRWVDSHAHSGLRSHTFNFTERSYGFRTRISRLPVGPDESLVFHTLLDPADPPGQLVVTVEYDKAKRQLLWDSPAHPATDKQRQEMTHIGQLPEAGEWTRLEATAQQIAGDKPKKELRLGGMSFEADRGRAYFDSPASLRRAEEETTTTEFTEAQRIDMTRDETGHWVARVPVERDVHWSLSFTNSLGHGNQAMKPMAIVATEDQPPAVHVERPGRDLTLPDPEAVPVMVRAFDDYGVGSIGVQFGESAETFGDIKWLEHYERPQRNRLLLTAVDPAELKAGQAMHYRMVVRDRNDQLVHSDVYRVAIAAADEATPEILAQRRTDLGDLLGGIGRLIDAQGQLITSVFEPLTRSAEGADSRPADELLTLTHPDGTPLTPDELRDLYQASLDALPEDERAALMKQLDQHLAEQRALVDAARGELDAAAQAAQRSAVAMPAQAQMLRDMARQLEQMQQAAGDAPEGEDEETLRRLAELYARLPQQQEELAELQRQIQQMQQAQQQLGQSPAEAQQQMAMLMAERQAQQQLQQLQRYNQSLTAQQNELAQLQAQLADLQAQSRQAQRAAELDDVSAQQQQLDEQVQQEIEQTQQMLPQRPAMAEQQPPPAPWTPPGERVQRMPVERDTPEEDPEEVAAADGESAPAAAAVEPEDDETNWWDEPVQSPQLGQTSEMDERFAERDTRPVERPEPQAADTAAATPRQMLQEHQNQVQQQLTENSNDLAAAQQRTDAIAQQIQELAAQLASQNAAQGEGAQGEGGQPSQAAGQSLQQLQQAMNSAEMRMAQSGAQRAMMLPGASSAAAQAAGSESGAASDSSSGAQPGEVMSMDLSGINLNSNQRAAVYRLPPRLREPLLQGMAERGPEGYQSLIDAYYRRLSQEER